MKKEKQHNGLEIDYLLLYILYYVLHIIAHIYNIDKYCRITFYETGLGFVVGDQKVCHT